MDSKNIGKVLKKSRERVGITVQQVSDILISKGFKATKNTIYSWENNNSQPTPDALLELCLLYQIDDILEAFGYGKDNSPDIDNLTEDEIKHLQKYRPLDAHGKEAVNAVLDVEHERMKKVAKNKIAIFPIGVVYDEEDENYEEDEEDMEDLPLVLQYASAGTGNYIDDDYTEMKSFPASKIPYGAEFAMKVSGDSMEPTIHDGQIVFVKPTPELYDGEIGIFIQEGDCFCKRLEVDYKKRVTYLVSDNEEYPKRKVTEDCRTIGRVLLKG